MSAKGVHKITEQFEEELCKYTGAPFCVAVDNASNAIFLSLYYEHYVLNKEHKELIIPACTYPSCPAEIIHAGYKVKFLTPNPEGWLEGMYKLYPSKTVDSALRFTADMYIANHFMCLSFTGPYKTLKLGKGGAILTDDPHAAVWFKKARFSGRDERPYMKDNFDINPVLGWNYYLMPEIAARGLLLMPQFYNEDGSKKDNKDLKHRYPDLSQFKLYQNEQ